MKWFLSLALVLFATTSHATFSDVSNAHPNSEAINYLKTKDIVAGNPDGTFKPDQVINRVEFLKILLESDTSERVCTEMYITYSDTDSSAWYDQYLQQAGNCGIAKGYEDGTFRPANGIKYAEATKMVVETLDPENAELYAEASQTQWYDKYVAYLQNKNLWPRENIQPSDSVTRGEMAEIIYRFLRQETQSTNPTQETSEPIVENPIYEDYSSDRFRELLSSKADFILNFSASWCPNCRRLDGQIRDNLESLPPETLVLKVDYDSSGSLKEQYGVTYQTTGVYFQGGNHVKTKGGLTFEDIEQFFE